jgi:hypothetical protein
MGMKFFSALSLVILLHGRHDYHSILQMGTVRFRKVKVWASSLYVELPWCLGPELFPLSISLPWVVSFKF